MAATKLLKTAAQAEKVEFQEVLMDLRTRELYVFFDHSLTMDREDLRGAPLGL